MENTEPNIQHGITLMAYIVEKLGGTGDFMRIFKLIYFADRQHLATYGRTISNDTYVAMKHGPVPSLLYDIEKYLRGEGFLASQDIPINRYFGLEGRFTLKLKEKPDYGLLSQSDIKAIDQSIEENKSLDFNSLSNKSHGSAWDKADFNDEINLFDIAREGGASNDMIEYIQESIEIQNLFRCR